MPITTEQVTLSDHQGAIRPGSSTSTALVSARTSQRQPSQRRTDSLDAAVNHARLFAQLLRAAETGAFQLTAELVELLREHRSSALGTITDERQSLERLRAGDMNHDYTGMTQCEGERGTLGHLEAYLGEVAVCDSVLNAVEGKH